MNDIIFYFGSLILISLFIYLVYIKFKDFPEIDLTEHKWIILLYIFLLVFSIIVWRIIYLVIKANLFEITKYNQIIQRVTNG